MTPGTSPPPDAAIAESLRLRHVVAAWVLVAILVLLQGAAEQWVDRGRVTAEFLLRWRIYPVTLWAAVTPLVLGAASRWSLRGRRWPLDVAAHALLFAVWMLVSNVLLRLPDLVLGEASGFARESAAAALEYAPAGALLWVGLVVLGGLRDPEARDRRRARQADDGGPSVTPPAETASRSARARPSTPLSLRQGYRTHLVPRKDVLWVEADGDYLRVHTERRTYRIRGPMKALQRELGDERFLRIHRSTLVNVSFVREVQPYFHGDYVAILRDGTELRVPRSRRAAIRRLRGD